MHRQLLALFGIVALGATGSHALAGGGGCSGRALECYQKVQTPDVYATVARQVVVRPGYSKAVHTPAVMGTRAVRVEAAPGGWLAVHEPAVYGMAMRSVMVSPARTEFTTTAPVYKTVIEHVTVSPATVRWEHKRDHFGHEKMCKVLVPAVTRAVERQVLVSPGHRVAHHVPAAYGQVAERVMIQPARVHNVYEPPVHQWVEQSYVARPASTHVVNHPPVVATEHHKVLVQRGGIAWQPVGGHGYHGGATHAVHHRGHHW